MRETWLPSFISHLVLSCLRSASIFWVSFLACFCVKVCRWIEGGESDDDDEHHQSSILQQKQMVFQRKGRYSDETEGRMDTIRTKTSHACIYSRKDWLEWNPHPGIISIVVSHPHPHPHPQFLGRIQEITRGLLCTNLSELFLKEREHFLCMKKWSRNKRSLTFSSLFSSVYESKERKRKGTWKKRGRIGILSLILPILFLSRFLSRVLAFFADLFFLHFFMQDLFVSLSFLYSCFPDKSCSQRDLGSTPSHLSFRHLFSVFLFTLPVLVMMLNCFLFVEDAVEEEANV